MSSSSRMHVASAWPVVTDLGLRLMPVYTEDPQAMCGLWWRPGELVRVH